MATHSKPSTQATHTSNSFAGLGDSDESEDEDESDMVQALARLTSKISVGPKVTQSQRRKGKKMDITRILAVAKKVHSGELSTPDLKMESNEEYEALWALVDTGAGVIVLSGISFRMLYQFLLRRLISQQLVGRICRTGVP